MRARTLTAAVLLAMTGCASWLLDAPAETSDVRTHAEQSFDQLTKQTDPQRAIKPAGGGLPTDTYTPDHYWIGKGQGDLAKGKIVCQRVSELSARTDLAKQIRVMVKEHMIDRVRERSGRDSEQDIELTREEIVQEYLLGVKIIDHHVDEENKICTATAVMPKTPMQPKPASDASGGFVPR